MVKMFEEDMPHMDSGVFSDHTKTESKPKRDDREISQECAKTMQRKLQSLIKWFDGHLGGNSWRQVAQMEDEEIHLAMSLMDLQLLNFYKRERKIRVWFEDNAPELLSDSPLSDDLADITIELLNFYVHGPHEEKPVIEPSPPNPQASELLDDLERKTQELWKANSLSNTFSIKTDKHGHKTTFGGTKIPDYKKT